MNEYHLRYLVYSPVFKSAQQASEEVPQTTGID